jgi:hypothetical protein
MKFKHLCGRRNLPKKLEEQQVNAGGSASPSSVASWGREETDASCATSVQARKAYINVTQNSERPDRNEFFV